MNNEQAMPVTANNFFVFHQERYNIPDNAVSTVSKMEIVQAFNVVVSIMETTVGDGSNE